MPPEIAQLRTTKALRRQGPPSGAPYVGRLADLRSVRRAAVAVFKDARQGRLDVADAGKLVQMLRVIGELISLAEIEPRLAALERAQ